MLNSVEADDDDSSRRKRARTETSAHLDGPRVGPTHIPSPSSHQTRPDPAPLVALQDHATELETPANSVYYAVANRSTFSIAGVMERDVAAETSPTAAMMSQDDPVHLGIL